MILSAVGYNKHDWWEEGVVNLASHGNATDICGPFATEKLVYILKHN